MTNEESNTKKFKKSELDFAFKLWKQGKLTSRRLFTLAKSSGDALFFMERFNELTGNTFKPAVEYYQNRNSEKKALEKSRKDVLQTANIIGLIENEEFKNELRKDIGKLSWENVAARISASSDKGIGTVKRRQLRKKALNILKKLPKRRRK
jgi:hypothetical protein